MGSGLMGEHGAESIHAHINLLETQFHGISNPLDRLKYIVKEHNVEASSLLNVEASPLKKLQSYVLCPGPEITRFRKWWHSLAEDNTVEVKFPHERHGLARRQSNHAMPDVIADFLEFVDVNSQPNGRQTGSHHAQYYFLSKFTRINPPRQ